MGWWVISRSHLQGSSNFLDWRHHKTANIQIFRPFEKKKEKKKRERKKIATNFSVKRSGPSSWNYVVGIEKLWSIQFVEWRLKFVDRYLTCPPPDLVTKLFHLHPHLCPEVDSQRTAKLHPYSYVKDDDVHTSSSSSSSRLCPPSIFCRSFGQKITAPWISGQSVMTTKNLISGRTLGELVQVLESISLHLIMPSQTRPSAN